MRIICNNLIRFIRKNLDFFYKILYLKMQYNYNGFNKSLERLFILIKKVLKNKK